MRLFCLSVVALVIACNRTEAPGAPADEGSEATPTPASASEEAAPKKDPFEPNDVVLDHTVETLDGQEKKLSDYRGKALVIVNTASQCGYTPQYADLQQIYERYRDRGLEVLAFPSNDFGEQEPGTNEEIRSFVDEEFRIEFAMFDKVHATGPDKSPLYKTLTEETGNGIRGDVKWNFTKFLVDPEGKVVRRFEPTVLPSEIETALADLV